MKQYVLLMMLLTLPVSTMSWADTLHTYREKHGCKLKLDMEKIPDTILEWKGKCKSGYAEGRGTLLAYEKGKLLAKVSVAFRQGAIEGRFIIEAMNNEYIARIEEDYTHSLRNGKSITYYKSGDVFTEYYANGEKTNHVSVTKKNGDSFDGEQLGIELQKGKIVYANGDQYEGEMTFGDRNWQGVFDARNGQGVFTKKGEPPQAGEFILDEYIDIKDAAAKDLMPAKLGLEFGMTREQVEALTGELTTNTKSRFRNAFNARHFPNEQIALPAHYIGDRNVYFDDEGKLYHIRVEFLLQEKTYFGVAEAMQTYGSIRRWLSLNYQLVKRQEAFPHYGEGVNSCQNFSEWEKLNQETFMITNDLSPHMAHAQRVIFDTGCGAIKPWENVYENEAGERFFVSIREGNLYATPIIYTAAIAGEKEIRRKMLKPKDEKK